MLPHEDLKTFEDSVRDVLRNHQLWDVEEVEFKYNTDVFILDKV